MADSDGMVEYFKSRSCRPQLQALGRFYFHCDRGSEGGEGKNKFGGRDLEDVAALLSLARGLDYVDNKNVFMYGF